MRLLAQGKSNCLQQSSGDVDISVDTVNGRTEAGRGPCAMARATGSSQFGQFGSTEFLRFVSRLHGAGGPVQRITECRKSIDPFSAFFPEAPLVMTDGMQSSTNCPIVSYTAPCGAS